MTATSFTQILNNTSPLQTASRAHRQNALYIPSTSFALCAEAALTPQYALTNNPFCKIVGRLYFSILHKCPKILFVRKNPTTFTTQLAVKTCTIFQQRFNTLLKFGHSALKCFPLQCSIANSFTKFQYLFCQSMKSFTYFAKFTFGLTDSLKIPFQMSPAYLANQFVKIVGTITVCYKFAARAACWLRLA